MRHEGPGADAEDPVDFHTASGEQPSEQIAPVQAATLEGEPGKDGAEGAGFAGEAR
ncbi:hypothetical protein D9M68_990280 [compost metagenome]